MDEARLQHIRKMLREFVDGSNRTPARAGELLSELERAFPDDHRAAEAIYSLALCGPGEHPPGESDAEILRRCVRALNLLDATPEAVTKP